MTLQIYSFGTKLKCRPGNRGIIMANRKTYHVTADGNGGWRVKAEGASRASSTHNTKSDAVESAKVLAKSLSLGQVVIHGKDGRIQTEHTYGKDPHPPEG